MGRIRNCVYLTSVLFILIHTVCSTPVTLDSEETKQLGVQIHRKNEPPDSLNSMDGNKKYNDLSDNSALSDTKTFVSSINFECERRQPLYAIKDSVREQGTRSPYIIKVESSKVSAGRTVSVSIETIGGHAFRGMILQVVPSDVGASGDNVRGRFLQMSEINLQSCHGENDTAILESPAAREKLKLLWTPSAGSNGDVSVVGTFVEDYHTFWTGVRSNQVTILTSGQEYSKNGEHEEVNGVEAPRESSEEVLGHNGVITVEKLASEVDGIFKDNGDNIGNGNAIMNRERNEQNVLYSAMKTSPLDFQPPQTAEIIGGLLKSMTGGGGGGGGGGLGSMFNMMKGLGTMSSLLGGGRSSSSGSGSGLLGSLLGGRNSGGNNIVPPPPSGLPPSGGTVISGGADEPSLADLLGVDPSTVIDNTPLAVPARSSPLSSLSGLLGGGGGSSGGGGIGSLLGNLGSLSSLAKLMGGSKSKQQQAAPSGMFGGGSQTNGFGGMFGGGQPPMNPQNQIMQQLQQQQMQIAALQRQLGQGSVSSMMGGFGNIPLSFGQQTNSQLLGLPGQRPGTMPGRNTGLFGQSQSMPRPNTQTGGFGQQSGFNNQFGSTSGRTPQQFPANGMFNNNMVQNRNQFPAATNTFGQTQAPAQNSQEQLMQELMRQNQLLMQQNQHLRTGNTGSVQGQTGGFNGQNNNFNGGQNLNNNNQGFPNGNGQNTNGFNNFGQNPGLNNNNIGTSGSNNFGQQPNANAGISSMFGQNSNMNGNSGVNGGNFGQNNNGFGQNSNFNGQNIGQNQNTNSIPGNNGQNAGIGTNHNGQPNGNQFGQNANTNSGNNLGSTNTAGPSSNGGNFGMNGNFGNNQNMNNNGNSQFNSGFSGGSQNGNNFGGNNQMGGGFGGGGQNGNNFGGNGQTNPGFSGNQNTGSNAGGSAIGQFGGSGGTLSGQLSGLLGSMGGSQGSGNNPLSGLMGSLGQGQGGNDLSSIMGNIDTSAIQGMLGQMGSGNGQGPPDISSLLGNVDTSAMQGLLQGEQGAGLMNSINGLMSSKEGGGLMSAVQGMMSGDPNAMKDIESIMSGENGGDIFNLAEQAQGLLSQSGIDPAQLLAGLG